MAYPKIPVTLELRIPPEFTSFIDYPTEGPSLIIVHLLANKAELQVSSFLPPVHNPPDLLVTAQLPLKLMKTMNALKKAFLELLPNIPLNVCDRYPSFDEFNMSIKIMIWNVQGAASQFFLTIIKELIRINKPTVVALVETHISGDSAQKVCDKIGFSGQLRVDAQGFSGGIWLFWKKEEVLVEHKDSNSQHITVEISKIGEEPWLFSAIYARPDSTMRRDLWEALENVKRNFNGPWLLGGDFNDTVSMSERQGTGGSEMQRRCRLFSNWMNENGLLDLGFSGPDHTWFRGNSPATFKSAQLDRFLASEDWRLKFEAGSVKHLPKSKSDHCPILLSTCGFAPIPSSIKPFRFQAAWINHAKFDEFVKYNWNNSVPLIPFQAEFAAKLSDWNRLVFHNIFQKKYELWARLNGVQKALSKGRNRDLIKLESKLRHELDDVLHQEEILWFQKSRVEFIRDGDRNTKFFHLSTVIRGQRNKIEMLQVNEGNWVSDAVEVKNMVVQYWRTLFTEEARPRSVWTLAPDYFPKLTEGEFNNLARDYSQCEISEAISSMNPFKAPGPDGFQPLFYQRYWDVVNVSVQRTVLIVLEGQSLPDNFANAYLVLIPKVDNPQFVTQFRPIGLCNIVYKAATKAIVNH